MTQPTNQSEITGTVLNIQRYCSHDGPGIRTTVFLKGCSLRCKWCSNPESIKRKPELSFGPETCIGAKECGACLKPPFPEGAFYVVDGGPDDRVRVNWDLATEIDQAMADLCPTDAIEMFGKIMTAEEVLDEVERDASFYRTERRRHDPERGRVSASAGLLRRVAGGGARARHRHRHRDCEQRALEIHGAGAASRRHRAARHQADGLRNGTRSGPGSRTIGSSRTSRKRTRRSPTRTLSHARR